jgi:ribose-phosphate pyrophosphokinase
MLLFALDATRTFAEKIAATLGVALSAHEEREFEDGEHKARPLVSVRGEDVFVIQSLHGGPDQSPNDKFCQLLFFLATMKENGAARVTAVIPYLAYARKDRQTKPRDPVTTRYVALLFEAVGTDRVVTLDVHNVVAFQNAFRCETVHLDTRRLFAERAIGLVGGGRVVVASPDPGGVKRAQLFREKIESMLGRPVGGAFVEKRRSAGVVTGNLLVGDVADATVLIVDDLISSGATMARAARACREGGAEAAYALAAHGLFTGDAASALRHQDLVRTFVTDTVPAFRLEKGPIEANVEIVSAAPLFAEAILALHEGNSIDALLEDRG